MLYVKPREEILIITSTCTTERRSVLRKLKNNQSTNNELVGAETTNNQLSAYENWEHFTGVNKNDKIIWKLV